MQLNLSHIYYTYPNASHPAVEDVTVTFPQGWTGMVGDNGCGKSTLASIAAGNIRPDSGNVAPSLFSAYCQQDSSVEPSSIADFASDYGRDAQKLRLMLGIEDDWMWRYETLSGGQQKRIQIACALWVHPDVLVMDEPTNDLDAESRALVADALHSFSGIGILISHDRALLDSLVSRCLIFEGSRFVLRPGSCTQALAQSGLERESQIQALDNARRERKRLEAEAARRKAEAARSDKKRSARNLDRHDSDGRERIGRAIVSGKDGVAAKLSSSMSDRLARTNASISEMRIPKRYAGRFNDHGSISSSQTLCHIPQCELRAGEFSLNVPELWIGHADHIMLTGNNGYGKTRLVEKALECLRKDAKVAYIPQNVDEEMRKAALKRLQASGTTAQGRMLSIIANLNSDPKRLMEGICISPGETKKLLLAEQMIDEPELLVLDEPTNHLDMGSSDALAQLLAGFPGAFLLVTHDAQLQKALECIRWDIARDKGKTSCSLQVIQ